MPISDDTKYAEAMNAIRHYSALRFVMLTIFIAITGGLVSTFTSDAATKVSDLFKIDVLRWAGMWISIVFLVFEFAINRYITELWLIADSCPGAPTSANMRKPYIRLLVAASALSLNLGALVFWAFLPCIKSA